MGCTFETVEADPILAAREMGHGMKAIAALGAGSWDEARSVGEVTLDHDQRHRRRIALRTDAGAPLLLDLPEARHLHDGAGLLLEDGGVVRVRAKPEPVLEIRAADPALFARLAWHLGNRHLEAAIGATRILIRYDHVIEAMVRGLGGTATAIEAPFDPEPGAYAAHDHG